MNDLVSSKTQTIEVTIEKKVFENQDSTFFIYIGVYKNSLDELSVKVNQELRIDGNYKLVGHPLEYNGSPSFQVKYIDIDRNSYDSKINILCSIDGIKQKTAELILNNFKGDLNEFKSEKPPKIKGIGPGKLELIKEGLELLDSMEVKKELSMMLGNTISQKQINEICEKIESNDFGYCNVEDFKINPYKMLIEEIEISFNRADKIAQALGIPKNSGQRIKYLIEYMVGKITKQGNCYCNKEILIEELKKIGITSIMNISDLKNTIDSNARLVIEGEKIYKKSIWDAEKGIPIMMKDLIEKDNKHKQIYKNVIDLIKEYEYLNKIKFDEYQITAIISAVNNPVTVITGGAGSGKTTLLKCVIYCLKEYGFRINGTAPTGKAARRFSQATSLKASTIHLYLNKSTELYPNTNGVMIIDEVSMVDVKLMYDAMVAMDESAVNYRKLIIVGDFNQLASVQSGNVLYDIIESKTIPVIRLTKTFRQGADSNIINIANGIIEGENFTPIKKSDFYVKYCRDTKEYHMNCLEFYERIFKKYSDLDTFFNDVQFIAPLKKGPVGTIELNKIIKNKFNPSKETDFIFPYSKENPLKIIEINKNGEIKKIGKTKTGKTINNPENYIFPFDKNDKVMNLKNDNLNEIYNGEIGRIIDIDSKTFTIYFSEIGKQMTYVKDIENVNKFQLAYVCTIHKLQGCEFRYIGVFAAQDSQLCDRRLLYTAFTRGKETVLFFTTPKIQSSIVFKNNLRKRDTFLKERLQEKLSN